MLQNKCFSSFAGQREEAPKRAEYSVGTYATHNPTLSEARFLDGPGVTGRPKGIDYGPSPQEGRICLAAGLQH